MEYTLVSDAELADPPAVLRHIKHTSEPGIYLLLDCHPFLEHPLHVRLIKEIAQDFDLLPRRLVLVSHALKDQLPTALRERILPPFHGNRDSQQPAAGAKRYLASGP